MKAGRDCCRLPLRTAQKHLEELQEATANTAAAIQMSVGAAVEVVLSQLDGIFTLEDQH